MPNDNETSGAGAFPTMPPAEAQPDAVRPKARETIHDVILAWFDEQARGTVLDAPAGYGHLSMRLKDLGYAVTCGEIEPSIFQAPGLQCIYCDLNRRIESEHEMFDYVACVDGLEHMTDPYQAVSEFSRVLKPGGNGVFSLPNYCNIERRFQYVLRGFFTKPVSTERFQRAGGNLFNFHNSILTITILEFMFRINGLEIVKILPNDVKRKQRLFLPLVWLLRLAHRLMGEAKRREYRSDLTLHPAVISGGNNLIFITRKTDS